MIFDSLVNFFPKYLLLLFWSEVSKLFLFLWDARWILLFLHHNYIINNPRTFLLFSRFKYSNALPQYVFVYSEFAEDSALHQHNSELIRCKPKKQHSFQEFLNTIDQHHDSEDEGIEDYMIGGYHPIHIGEVLLRRYVVIQKLGWGHFSTVWLCKDFKYKTYVAVKIQKSESHYMEAAFDEVEILQKVQSNYKHPDWEGKHRDDTHVVGLLNAFIHKTHYGNHFCMVFEILRCNLLDIIKRYDYQGIPIHICQEISRQILIGLDYLHRICGVIHTDLKPENVMVCLNDDQIREIIEDGQLTKNQLFAERTKMIQKHLGFNTKDTTKTQQNKKINSIEQKLKSDVLTKNQKKNLKRKLKKEKEYPGKQNTEECEQDVENEVSLEELFDLKKGKITFNRGGQLSLPFKVKIADLGNACWKHHHFSTEIQTRQYRSPEVILGQSYNQTADIWSFACMMYELLTGDLLFQPKLSEEWSKNADHLAQMQELLGPFHKHFIKRSPKATKYFDKNGSMKQFPNLSQFDLTTVLQIKNKIRKQEANSFAQFLKGALIAEPELRASASLMLKSSWLDRCLKQDYKMNEEEYRQLRNKFNENEEDFRGKDNEPGREESHREYSLLEQGEEEGTTDRVADIRYVDRSFTDLGYIGYSEGISLQGLDTCQNWQFS